MRTSRRRIFMRWMACSLAIQVTLPCSCNRLPRSNSVFGVKPDRRLCARVAGDLVATVGAPIVWICRRVPAWIWPGRIGAAPPMGSRSAGRTRPLCSGALPYAGRLPALTASCADQSALSRGARSAGQRTPPSGKP